MKPGRKKITLPGGGICVVRKLSERDFIASGQTPLFLTFISKSRQQDVSEEKAFESLVRLTEVILHSCCGPITQPDGTQLLIVKKAFHECGENEVTIDDLDQDDASAIVFAVHELSGLRKEAVAAAATFPEGQERGSGDSPAGADIQRPADNAP